jgi:primary-amine oxidase
VASSTETRLHPLDPLTPAEVERAVGVVRELKPGLLRFVTVMLREPIKSDLLAWPERSSPRQAEVVVLSPQEELSYEVIVDLASGELVEWVALDGLQPAMVPEEYTEIERLMLEHPDFLAALRRRGIEDAGLVCVDPIPAGAWGDHQYTGRRLCRALAWVRAYPDSNPYARPIEGVVGLIDLNRGEVLEVTDHGAVRIPPGVGEYRASRLGRPRTDLKPIEITQPEGPSFTLDGNLVEWQKWSFRIGFTAREGLVLHQLGYRDGERLRPILHRASYSEMAIPYGYPSPTRYLQSPFDIGENLVGTLANSLELGCDCLGEIRYLDATVSNGNGEPVVIRNAICLHEEDFGILWKHWDFRTGETEMRRSRRLVISSISTIGNYDYGFFWYLYQDGTIESEVKATGIIATSATPPGETPKYGQLVAEGVNGMIHQHFFNVRLDFDLDGIRNSVYEVHTESTPPGEDNPYGNGFYPVKTLLRNESDAADVIDPLHGRSWVVINADSLNAVGEPVGYKLIPGENVLAFAQPDSAFARRAGFAYKHVWVTPYEPKERYAAGEYPNQHQGGDGLPAWIAQGRSIENEDIVVWYSFGLHHLPRPEDWPVMPVHHIGFMLKPFGFFDENPALDVPPPEHRHESHCAHHAESTGLR